MVLLNPSAVDSVANRRACEAEDAVLRRFVGQFLHLPGTRIARTVAPAQMAPMRHHGALVQVNRSTPFHYWWQAHLLDAIVDGGLRRLSQRDEVGARRSALLGRQLLRTITLRNRGTVRNHYYDDMAWLALATHRLDQLHRHLGEAAANRSRQRALRSLTAQLRTGQHDGGALFWNKDRNFLNAAASGPAALHLLRSGRLTEGRGALQWILDHLLDDRGLIMDGLRTDGAMETRIYTYNQGPAIAALLELGDPRDIERASALVVAVGAHLSAPGSCALVTHGNGDGGLFTGILVRYLALASLDDRLTRESRAVADGLVRGTAAALWESRDPSGIFPATLPPRKPGSTQRRMPVELSTQLQGWMVMEAVASLEAPRRAET